MTDIALDALKPVDWTVWTTRYLFFTGKGGVGKTTTASAAAIRMADDGKRVLLVSTDPASNLDDLFGVVVGSHPTPVPECSGLFLINIDPEAAAEAYRERVIGPYQGVMEAEELRGLIEQLSGACTVEIAAFDEFTRLLAGDGAGGTFDHVVFDTAPTGHTMRLLNLAGAWSDYLRTSPAGASCLGPLTGLDDQRDRYNAAVTTLANGDETTLVLVSRPELPALREAARTSVELRDVGLDNQHLVLNGVFPDTGTLDPVAASIVQQQADALRNMPGEIASLPQSSIPLIASNLQGVDALRKLSGSPAGTGSGHGLDDAAGRSAINGHIKLDEFRELVDALESEGPGAVMVMGKGGVGKTTIAASVAVELAKRGHPVHLTTTDPAAHLQDTVAGVEFENLTVNRIDPAVELERHREEVLKSAGQIDDDERALLEEDLRSPCTEEIAVFKAFSRTLSRARREFVVLDTAPTGHTLLLLDTTGSYHREILRNMKDQGVSGRMVTPLMRLQDPAFTRVLIVTLPQSTPVLEAERLQDDLRRAGIEPYGWVINQTLQMSGSRHPLLASRAALETPHIERVVTSLASRTWGIPWRSDVISGEHRLVELTPA